VEEQINHKTAPPLCAANALPGVLLLFCGLSGQAQSFIQTFATGGSWVHHVKLGCRAIAQLIACIHHYLAQLLQLLLFDLTALYHADGLIIRTIANVQVLKPVVLLTPVFHLDICHHRVFAAAIAAGENTRCCHGQSHHTSALQEITTSHISHFLAPHKLFCFFLFSFARLRKRRLVCHN